MIARVAALLCLAPLACSDPASDGGGGASASGGTGALASGGGAGSGATGGGLGGGGSGGSGGASGGASGGMDAGLDAAGGSAGAPTDAGACTPVSLGAFQLLDTEPGGSSLAFTVVGLPAGQQHAAYVEFYDSAGPQATGSFDLSKPPDDNYSTCARCLLVYEDLMGTPTAFYPETGTMQISKADTAFTGSSAGSLQNVTLVEVTVDKTVTTKVPGGRCLSLSGTWP